MKPLIRGPSLSSIMIARYGISDEDAPRFRGDLGHIIRCALYLGMAMWSFAISAFLALGYHYGGVLTTDLPAVVMVLGAAIFTACGYLESAAIREGDEA